MKTNEKGYSLNVLVITIAVMLILTTTAILTVKNLTGDREIANFMNDLQEVETYSKDYYSRKKVLPIRYDNDQPVTFNMTDSMLLQADSGDMGEYYEIDLDKLGKMKLSDTNRGYILNESTLKVYVKEPVKYNGVDYYTLTKEILGIDKVYGRSDSFEIRVTGNSIVWTSSCKLMVSIPNHEEAVEGWVFKYYDQGPIEAKDFKNLGTFFEYGKPIEITKNGIYTIYVQDKDGFAKVVNIVVSKIDDIPPYIYLNGSKIIASDDETGIKDIMYKIADYGISANSRVNDIKTYVQGNKSDLPSSSVGTWTYTEAYTGEKVGTASLGRSVSTYKKEYEEYLEKYAEIEADPSGDVRELDDKYPQFQHNGVMYGDDEKNIVLYVEDYAGNGSVTDKSDSTMIIVSRKMLIDNNLIGTAIKPLNGASVIINNGDEYTGSRKVNLVIKAQGAESMYITNDPNDIPGRGDWIEFKTSVAEHDIGVDNGRANVYVFVTANQEENGQLKYAVVSDSIYVDTTKPTKDAPTVTLLDNNRLKVTSNQKDTGSGIAKIEFGYRKESEKNFTWKSSLDNIVLEEGTKYIIKTRATDHVGNVQESDTSEIESEIQSTKIVPNEPAMATGMKAIAWDSKQKEFEIDTATWKTSSGTKLTWYDYAETEENKDSRNSIWANAKTSDGSYWVWIPRFAYRITYYTDSSNTKVKGYYQNTNSAGINYYNSDGTTVATDPENVKSQYVDIEVIFLNGTSSTQYREKNATTNVTVVKELPVTYIVHPAFQRISSNTSNNLLGKWSSELTGIWVAKFEASRSDATFETEGTSEQVKSVPSVKSLTGLTISDAYKYSIEMQPTMYSHLMKNSEWGAVTYLTHSIYGRNGREVSSNRMSDKITGAGGSTQDSTYTCTSEKFASTYAYNATDNSDGKSGIYASTTGNVSGVYDMAGGVAEYVATYLGNGNDILIQNGKDLINESTIANREIYNPTSTDQPVNNYRKNGTDDGVYGNAMYETSNGYVGNYGINADTSNFIYGSLPFVTRGGSYSEGTSSGLFNFNAVNGATNNIIGFRPVLAFR